jgi:hypothetical protein
MYVLPFFVFRLRFDVFLWKMSRKLPSIKTRESEIRRQGENGDSQDTAIFERIEAGKSKLELYRNDPLVDIRGLKRYS